MGKLCPVDAWGVEKKEKLIGPSLVPRKTRSDPVRHVSFGETYVFEIEDKDCYDTKPKADTIDVRESMEKFANEDSMRHSNRLNPMGRDTKVKLDFSVNKSDKTVKTVNYAESNVNSGQLTVQQKSADAVKSLKKNMIGKGNIAKDICTVDKSDKTVNSCGTSSDKLIMKPRSQGAVKFANKSIGGRGRLAEDLVKPVDKSSENIEDLQNLLTGTNEEWVDPNELNDKNRNNNKNDKSLTTEKSCREDPQTMKDINVAKRLAEPYYGNMKGGIRHQYITSDVQTCDGNRNNTMNKGVGAFKKRQFTRWEDLSLTRQSKGTVNPKKLGNGMRNNTLQEQTGYSGKSVSGEANEKYTANTLKNKQFTGMEDFTEDMKTQESLSLQKSGNNMREKALYEQSGYSGRPKSREASEICTDKALDKRQFIGSRDLSMCKEIEGTVGSHNTIYYVKENKLNEESSRSKFGGEDSKKYTDKSGEQGQFTKPVHHSGQGDTNEEMLRQDTAVIKRSTANEKNLKRSRSPPSHWTRWLSRDNLVRPVADTRKKCAARKQLIFPEESGKEETVDTGRIQGG